MRTSIHRSIGIALTLLAWTASNHAQTGLSADLLRLYGGVYAMDCARPDSPKLRVERQTLQVEQGDRRLAARGPLQAIHAYFGQSAPPGFLVALEGEVRSRHQITFLVYGDAKGQYVNLDGTPAVLANLGPLAKARFNHCDAAISKRAASVAKDEQQAREATRAPMTASRARSPSELVRDARFRTTWLNALGPLSREPWLALMNGPAPELRTEQLAGQDWLLAAFCKPHDCGEHNAVLVYDEASGQVHGLVHRAGRNSLVGAPPAKLSADLQRIWRREWRQGR